MHVNVRFDGRLRWAGGSRFGSDRRVGSRSRQMVCSTHKHPRGPGRSLECLYLCGMGCISVRLPCIIEMRAFVVGARSPNSHTAKLKMLGGVDTVKQTHNTVQPNNPDHYPIASAWQFPGG